MKYYAVQKCQKVVSILQSMDLVLIAELADDVCIAAFALITSFM